MEFAFAPENTVFTVSILVMLGIAILEGVLAVFGFGFSSFLDDLVPDGLGGVDANAELSPGLRTDMAGDSLSAQDVGSPSALSRLLGWLFVGKVPMLVLLVAFLTSFGLAGFWIQSVWNSVAGFYLPAFVSVPPAFLVALPGTRLIGKVVSRLIPSDETTAVSQDSLIGRLATITLGTASIGEPAQAKTVDQHRQSHYVMVEPAADQEAFTTGERVLLVSREGAVYRAIANPNPELVPDK